MSLLLWSLSARFSVAHSARCICGSREKRGGRERKKEKIRGRRRERCGRQRAFNIIYLGDDATERTCDYAEKTLTYDSSDHRARDGEGKSIRQRGCTRDPRNRHSNRRPRRRVRSSSVARIGRHCQRVIVHRIASAGAGRPIATRVASYPAREMTAKPRTQACVSHASGPHAPALYLTAGPVFALPAQ